MTNEIEIEKESMSEDDLIGLINFDDLLNFEEAFDLRNVEGNFEDLINVEGNVEDLNIQDNVDQLINEKGSVEDALNVEINVGDASNTKEGRDVGTNTDTNDTNEKEKVLERRIEMLEEQIKRIVNEKEGENEETRRAELERKMLDKKYKRSEKKLSR